MRIVSIAAAAAVTAGCTVGRADVHAPRPTRTTETIPAEILDRSDPSLEPTRDVREPWTLALGLQDLVRWWKDQPRRGYTGRDGREAERQRLLRRRRGR